MLIVAGDEENLRILRDLVAQMDQPDAGKDRRIEVYVLANATPADAATTLRAMFGGKSRSDEQVIVTPQPSTNSLIVSRGAVFEQVEALLKQIDARRRRRTWSSRRWRCLRRGRRTRRRRCGLRCPRT